MDAEPKNNPAGTPAGETIPATLAAIAERAQHGETVGLIVIELHPDGSADRWALGTVLSDRHRLAGLALDLAHGALRA